MHLQGKIACITGGSRGIGFAIAKKLAMNGVHVILLAKTVDPHPKLPGTLMTAVKDIENAGGKASAMQLDVRDDEAVVDTFKQIQSEFGALHFLINNASAIFLAGTAETPMKRFDLMHQVNVRGTYHITQQALPLLKKADGAHILTLSPPLNLQPKWFEQHVAYTMSKYGMSMCVLGWAEEFKDHKIAANALWPETTIATAAIQNLLGGDILMNQSRTPEIVADAAFEIFSRDPATCTGNFFIDTAVLEESGITDFEKYSFKPGKPLMKDFFLD